MNAVHGPWDVICFLKAMADSFQISISKVIFYKGYFSKCLKCIDLVIRKQQMINLSKRGNSSLQEPIVSDTFESARLSWCYSKLLLVITPIVYHYHTQVSLLSCNLLNNLYNLWTLPWQSWFLWRPRLLAKERTKI